MFTASARRRERAISWRCFELGSAAIELGVAASGGAWGVFDGLRVRLQLYARPRRGTKAETSLENPTVVLYARRA